MSNKHIIIIHSSILLSLLRTAISTNKLTLVQSVHSLIITSGHSSNRLLINNLINTYSKCTSLLSARHLFDSFPYKDLVTWNSILSAYALSASNYQEFLPSLVQNPGSAPVSDPDNFHIHEGFCLFHLFRKSSLFPNDLTLAPVLKLCLISGNVTAADNVLGFAIKIGLERDTFVSGALINIFSKFGRTNEAWTLFSDMPDTEKDVVLYNVMLKMLVQKGLEFKAFRLFCEFHRSGLRPDYLSVQRVLNGISEPSCQEQIRGYTTKLCLLSDESSDMILRNKKLSEYHRAGDNFVVMECFIDMMRFNVGYDSVAVVVSLAAVTVISNIELGRQMHAIVIKLGFDFDVAVSNSLINMYSKLGFLNLARKVFSYMKEFDIVSYNSMIAGCAQSGLVDECVRLYQVLLRDRYSPDNYTLASVLGSCSNSSALGQQFHVQALKTGNIQDNFVSTSLIDVYTRAGRMKDAEFILQNKDNFDLTAWNALMFGYILCKESGNALELFTKMQKSGEGFDEITLATAAKACGSIFNLNFGKQIHVQAIKTGVFSDLCISGGILDMYIKCGEMGPAHVLFEEINLPDEIAWTSMISGFVENGEEDIAIHIYHRMRQSGIYPDEYTFATLLKASSCLTALEDGRQIHANVIKSDCATDTYVLTALIDMYAKCGNIEDSYRLFRKMDVRDIALWNAMLVGLAQHGHGIEALKLFETMKFAGIKPDKVTFIGVLSACSHSGLTSEAHEYFHLMHQNYGIKPESEHYSCLVDALGRAGRVEEAEDLITKMPFEASASMYRALLGACRVKGDKETGKNVAKKLLALEPYDSAAYVLLSNIFAASEHWKEMGDARQIMRRENVQKDPGFSWIDVKSEKHLFVANERSHPQAEMIYRQVEDVISLIKKEGYVADTEFVLLDVEREEKERALYYHSEKLAISFALMVTSPSTVIRVIKNLRVCGDCHNAIKYISKVYARQIVVRDANRFHHFRDGLCSCGDYW